MNRLTKASRAAAVVLLATVLVSCAGAAASDSSPDNSLGLLILAPDKRPIMPDLAGDSLMGGQVSLSDFAGKVVLLNAFASWCGPCQEELPVLAAAARMHPDVQFVGLDVEDDDAAARGFLAAEQASFPVIKDPSGQLLASLTLNPSRGLPITFIVDAQGRAAGRILGKATAESIRQAVEGTE